LSRAVNLRSMDDQNAYNPVSNTRIAGNINFLRRMGRLFGGGVLRVDCGVVLRFGRGGPLRGRLRRFVEGAFGAFGGGVSLI